MELEKWKFGVPFELELDGRTNKINGESLVRFYSRETGWLGITEDINDFGRQRLIYFEKNNDYFEL